MPGYKQRIAADGSELAGGGAGLRAPYASASAFRDTGGLSLRLELRGLIRTIEAEVIPGILTSLRAADAGPTVNRRRQPASGAPIIESDTVIRFMEDVVAGRDLRAPINKLLQRGATIEQLYRELLTPAARQLGTRWDEDTLNFADVTLAIGRLQQLLREMSNDFLGHGHVSASPARSILLAPCPGEQHLFGFLMVGEYFRRAGWDVVSLPGCSRDELVEAVGARWFAAVGLSAGSSRLLVPLKRSIAAVRKVSQNPGIAVVVGGAAFLGYPERVASVGADAGANDAREAPHRTERLVALLADSG